MFIEKPILFSPYLRVVSFPVFHPCKLVKIKEGKNNWVGGSGRPMKEVLQGVVSRNDGGLFSCTDI